MAASDFSFQDYLLYTGATDANIYLYSTVASGVLGVLNNEYNIYPVQESITKTLFIDSTSFRLLATPVVSITSLTYDGAVIDPALYTWYGEEVTLSTPITDYKKPITAVLSVGYVVIPQDLKLAIYQHIDAVIFAIQKQTDSIQKVVNSTGNTTFYRDTAIPKRVLAVYEYYSARTQVMF